MERKNDLIAKRDNLEVKWGNLAFGVMLAILAFKSAPYLKSTIEKLIKNVSSFWNYADIVEKSILLFLATAQVVPYFSILMILYINKLSKKYIER